MYRIDNATAITPIPTPAAVGPNVDHFFTNGDPGSGIAATIVDADWANAIQEEIAYVIEQSGATLSKTTRTQLLTAIKYFIQNNLSIYAASTTAANTYTATLSPAPASYATGDFYIIKFTNHNTGAATLNLNSLGAKSIVRTDSTALSASDIVDGMIALLSYDGTNLQLLNRSHAADIAAIKLAGLNRSYNYIADSGAANAYVATLSPAATAYTTGMMVSIKIANTNTGASTLNVNGLGVQSIKTMTGLALQGGELIAGTVVDLYYDGTNFKLSYAIRRTAIQVFTSSGTYTPTAGMYEAKLECIGGGGGGGAVANSSAGNSGSAGGGGGGSYSVKFTNSATVGASQTVTVGTAGSGGAGGGNNAGGNGGDSSVGTICIGKGGTGGSGAGANGQGAGGAGGVLGTGDIRIVGNAGCCGVFGGNVGVFGPAGGAGPFGGSGGTGLNAAGGPAGATNSGAGGAGACSQNGSNTGGGGAGGTGLVIITETLLV